MAGWEILGGILNIAHIIGVILQHVDGYHRLKGILEDAETRAKRIESNIRLLQHLYTLDGVQAEIIQAAVQDFEKIRIDLVTIQEKVTNRSTAINFLSSPTAVQELSKINAQLAAKDDTVKVIGMIGSLNAEHRNDNSHIVSLLTEIKSKSSDTSSVGNTFAQLFRMKMIEENVRNITKGREVAGFKQSSGFIHLSAGVCLYKGEFGVKDYEEAARHFNAAVCAGKSEAYYYLGMLYKLGWGVEQCSITSKNFFQQGADAGDPAAIAQLGNCYHYGLGVERDSEKGMECLKQAAEAGDPYGMGAYAHYKLHGYNTNVNLPLVFTMSSKAVKYGEGINELACCYDQGIGTERDPVEAVRLYTEAIRQASGWTACLPLARCYEEGNGVEVNLKKAMELYKRGTKAPTFGRSFFHAYYGLCLIRGRGIEKDEKQGWIEIQKSIQDNNAVGWFVKGECYRFGYGVEPDLVKAASYYKRAITTGNGIDGKIRASFSLGCMYELGNGGVERNLAEAFKHFNFAANRMHQKSQFKVAIACESGTGVNCFEDRAVYYFRLAANSGHRSAQLKASKYYMKGKGVSRDLHTAIQILRPAAENGDLDAQRLLRRLERRVVLRRMLPTRTKSLPIGVTWFGSE